jgi:hypothetical protein
LTFCFTDTEARLTKKCQELSAENVCTTAKVQTALKIMESGQQTIIALKKETEKASKLVDSSHEQVWFYKSSNCMPWNVFKNAAMHAAARRS